MEEKHIFIKYSIMLTPELMERISIDAAKRGWSKSLLIREIIKDHYNKEKNHDSRKH